MSKAAFVSGRATSLCLHIDGFGCFTKRHVIASSVASTNDLKVASCPKGDLRGRVSCAPASFSLIFPDTSRSAVPGSTTANRLTIGRFVIQCTNRESFPYTITVFKAGFYTSAAAHASQTCSAGYADPI